MPICPNLGNEAKAVEPINATKVNQTVHAPWSERAFNAVATPMKPLPHTRV
jgi:hypothetical protein